jgi:hypothetical protein
MDGSLSSRVCLAWRGFAFQQTDERHNVDTCYLLGQSFFTVLYSVQ